MPSHIEKRRPRESFSRIIERICLSLCEGDTRTVKSRCSIFRGEFNISAVRIDEVWVVGSYARGALLCGDLDLVIRMEAINGALPYPKEVARAFFGSLPLVRYYQGTPEKNSSGVAFQDAVLIWRLGYNWQEALKSIKPDPTAGRAAREIDEIPFRLEQLRVEPDELKELIELRKRKIYEWDFIHISDDDLTTLSSDEDLHESEHSLIHRSGRSMGSKSQQLIPALIRFLRLRDPHWVYNAPHYGQDRNVVHCGSTVFYLGKPVLDLDRFKREPGVWEIVVIPHISARGPNGILAIRRGEEHPDVLALSCSAAYYFCHKNRPAKIIYSTTNGFSEITVIELATSFQAAEDWRKGIYDSEPVEDTPEIAHVKGALLLEAIKGADAVEILSTENQTCALTSRGVIYFQECDEREGKKSTIEDIAKAFRQKL